MQNRPANACQPRRNTFKLEPRVPDFDLMPFFMGIVREAGFWRMKVPP